MIAYGLSIVVYSDEISHANINILSDLTDGLEDDQISEVWRSTHQTWQLFQRDKTGDKHIYISRNQLFKSKCVT